MDNHEKRLVPDRFRQVHLPDIRSFILKHNLVLTDCLRFHKNTEFKARAATYHLQQFDPAYAMYWKVQGAPDAQSIYNHDHPLKEVLFFEFMAATTALLGCVDSYLQEINCIFSLGLSETMEEGRVAVSMKSVVKRLTEKCPESKTLQMLNDFESAQDKGWFRFLRRLRNTALHADLYANSFEARNVAKIMNLLDEKAATKGNLTKEDVLAEMKRDVIFRLDGSEYPLTGLIHELREKTLGWLNGAYEQLDGDLDALRKKRKPSKDGRS